VCFGYSRCLSAPTPPSILMTQKFWRTFLCKVVTAASMFAATTPERGVTVGAAKVDITPDFPIRLSGYQNRPTEATRAETRLFARALAIGSGNDQPVVLITAELIGIGGETSESVAAALKSKHGIDRSRVAFSATHVHSGPALTDAIPYMFSRDLPPEEADRIARYTVSLRQKLVQVAEAALTDRKAGRLAWSEGKTDFAAQRRVIVDGKWKTFGIVPDGFVDHALPVLRASDERGDLRAVFINYACHCTTLTGGDNFVHHDWAGDAARRIEAENAGAVALVALGCGADANPNPRGVPAVAGHGEKVAAEVKRLLAAPMRALGPVTAASFRTIELPFDRAVPREELETRAADRSKIPASYAASKFLTELDAGRPLPKTVPYPIQTWAFSSDLAMVFLAGEVVSEYSLRLKRELSGARIWVNAYSNSLPCYIPSKRMFPEGGYEVDSSMDYYGWPTRLAIGTEDQIVQTVQQMVPATFRNAKK
jgi:neutral ceramidase